MSENNEPKCLEREELKECPFYGHEHKLEYIPVKGVGAPERVPLVYCQGCNVSIPYSIWQSRIAERVVTVDEELLMSEAKTFLKTYYDTIKGKDNSEFYEKLGLISNYIVYVFDKYKVLF